MVFRSLGISTDRDSFFSTKNFPRRDSNGKQMVRIDFATLLGLVLCAGFMAFATVMGGGTLGTFIDAPSVLVTIGGSLATVMICFPLRSFFRSILIFRVALQNKSAAPGEAIAALVRMAEIARMDGLLALEQKATGLDNPFLTLGLQMTADGTSLEVIEGVLRAEMEALNLRHKEGKAFFDQLGKLGPAFGMIGTLLGLILMLGKLDDPGALGPGMAVALITTLYGSLLSNVVCLPVAEKLAHLNREELRMMEIVVRGIQAIHAGDSPRLVQRKLECFLPPNARIPYKQRAA